MAVPRPPLILLPPSESKLEPTRGASIDLGRLSFPRLTELRDGLLDEGLRLAPTVTAARLYTGVLYTALDIATLPPRAAQNILIVSAQFGALRVGDRIPPYRRVMDPGYWRDGLRETLDEATAGRIIVDCRSSTYVAAWRPPAERAAQRVQIAVVEERRGVRRVVSHLAKKTRGEVARHLLGSGARPRTIDDLAGAVAERFTCELEHPPRPNAPAILTVVQA